MQFFSQRKLALTVALALAGAPAVSFATNGYFLIGYGSKSRAMGGVGVAFPQDGMAAAANPAAMAGYEMNTMRVDGSVEFFVPKRSVSHNSALLPVYDEQSGANEFLIPAMGGMYKFNRKITVGMAAIGAGLGTRYKQPWDSTQGLAPNGQPAPSGYFFNFQGNASDTVGVSMMQMQMLPSVAYKINKQHAVGASLAIGVQTFRAYGLQAFGADGSPLNYTSDREHLTNKGNDWSYGAGVRLGWLGTFYKKRLNLGVNYASKVYMSKFDKYKGLFAEQGDFDMPSFYSVGIAYHPNDKLTLAMDIQRNLFSDIASVGNPGPDVNDPSNFFPSSFGCPSGVPIEQQTCALGRDKGMGFGWEDQTVYKLGVKYDYNKEWTLRAGFNYGKAPIPGDQTLFSLLAPGVTEKHLTLGFSYRPSPQLEISMNYMHALKTTITGKTPFYPVGINDAADLRNDNAALSMFQHSVGLTIGYQI